jgi:S1-C subfamily serine protease
MHDDPRHFQISVAVQKGSSGGPLLDAQGRVVGVIAAKLDAAAALKTSGDIPQNVNYALRSDSVFRFLETVPGVRASWLETSAPAQAFADLVSRVIHSVALVQVY